jgi:hypothetical protein
MLWPNIPFRKEYCAVGLALGAGGSCVASGHGPHGFPLLLFWSYCGPPRRVENHPKNTTLYMERNG